MLSCNKLAQKESKARHDLVGKAVNREFCKRLKHDYTIKWNKHKPDSILKNETHKILCDFEIQTDQLNLARRADLLLFNKPKENLSSCAFGRSIRLQSKNKKAKR